MNSGGQNRQDSLYRADGTVTLGGTAQLVLARSICRSYLRLQNLSAGPLYVEFGAGAATATVSGGVVTAVAVTNAGAGFTRTPIVQFLGGGGKDGPDANSSYVGLGQPNAASPTNYAQAHCVMTGSAGNLSIGSIVVDNGGSNYIVAPYVFINGDPLDPGGYSVPAAGVGLYLPAGAAPEIWNGTICPTDAISIWGATTGQQFSCRWMD